MVFILGIKHTKIQIPHLLLSIGFKKKPKMPVSMQFTVIFSVLWRSYLSLCLSNTNEINAHL